MNSIFAEPLQFIWISHTVDGLDGAMSKQLSNQWTTDRFRCPCNKDSHLSTPEDEAFTNKTK
jgi:hypothetical protein